MHDRRYSPKDIILGCSVGAIVLSFVAMAVYEKARAPNQASATAAESAQVKDPGLVCPRDAQATAEVALARGLVRDVAVRKDGVHIVVNVVSWARMSIDDRDRMVSAFDCSMAGPDFLKKVIVETPVGSALKVYRATDLLEARRLSWAG